MAIAAVVPGTVISSATFGNPVVDALNAGVGLHQSNTGTAGTNQETAAGAELVLDGEAALNLAVGDIVLVTGTASARADDAGGNYDIDLQVVQPLLGTTTLAVMNVGEVDIAGSARMTSMNVGIFTAAEAGVHTFQQTAQRTAGAGTWHALTVNPRNVRAVSFRVLA